MKRAARIGVGVAAGLAVGLVFLGTWFYATIPEPPTPPADLGRDDSARSAVAWPAVRGEVIRMGWVDQAVRKRVTESIREGGTEGLGTVVRLLKLSVLESRVDEKNTARLKALIDKHGWLHAGRVGEEGAQAAFLIAQHADHDPRFQEKVLRLLREAYENGTASSQQVALLTDRVRVNQGKPQVYGTQAEFREGEVRFEPIHDSSGVDQRRKEMGLPPLKDYADSLRVQVGQFP